ncbi:chymotrypsin-2-like isoform X1 [Drosophila nasuta]|uniref:chymotrypsin-2-like isoform X1 n=1 Tax=Drosophila nasuta TaxID=42062 RepID=UPI00295F5393|nr:chymotrypsin-2-like isoform X1 [Drosophila nasuta]
MRRPNWQLIIVTFLLYQRSISGQDTPSKRIVKGFNADPKQFPYQVYILNLEDGRSLFGCGAVIISNRIVLTVAHCISKEMNTMEIYFGTVDTSNKREVGQQRLIVKAKNIFVHPEYDGNQHINDIALIQLPADLLFDEYIQPAKLPDADELYENESAVVSGWGQTIFSGPQSNHLQYYNVTVFSNEKCKNLMIAVSKIFPTSYICLKPSQSTPCHGDSGGPLAIRNEDGSHTLLGLTSFGNPGCPTNSPGVYTRVSSFLKWIKQYE